MMLIYQNLFLSWQVQKEPSFFYLDVFTIITEPLLFVH